MILPRRLSLTDADRQAWAEHETANARAADMYEALPLAGHGGRIAHCCSCGAVALGLCRACRAEGAS